MELQPPVSQEAANAVAPALEEGGIDMAPAAPTTPVYKMMADSRIPVSKSYGKLWRSRRDQELSKRKKSDIETAWNEAIDYYGNDQTSNRVTGTQGNFSRNRVLSDAVEQIFSETENIVFANTNALVPLIYSKNPSIEVTPRNTNNEEMRKLAHVLEKLVEVIFDKVCAPGINLKPKAKRAVILALLTNSAYFVLDFVNREQSSEQAMRDLQSLTERFQNAKNQEELAKIEGELAALEEKIAFTSPKGFKGSIKLPHEVVYDTVNGIDSIYESKWFMYSEYVPTSQLRAVYYTEENDEIKSIFQPTHVVRADAVWSEGMEDDSALSLFDEKRLNAGAYGYSDDDTFRAAQLTKVWYVWDRVTRRVNLFNDKDWKWPLWVWDDPIGLEEFFPVYQLKFYTSPLGGDSKGEVTYYLDQQDAINEINSEVRQGRNWAINNVFYDTNSGIDKEDVMKLLKGNGKVASPVNVPEGKKLEDCIASFIPPALKHPEFFDKQSKYAAIDRISSVKIALQGVEYKTNTTNEAIQNYQQGTQNILDERLDAIEDWIGKIGFGVIQLALMNYDAQEVSQLIGEDVSQTWIQMQADQIKSTFTCTVVGGSTQKPTSAAKKSEAMQVGQVLGQFADMAPPTMLVMLKLFEQAFDGIIVTEEDWDLIRQFVAAKLQSMQAEAQPQGVQQLPPEAQAVIEDAVKQGVPREVATQEVMKKLQGAQQQQPQSQPTVQ